MDYAHQEVTIDGAAVAVLTPTEYRLLATLVRHQGQVLSSGSAHRIGLGRPERAGALPGQVRRSPPAQEAGLGRRRRLADRNGPRLRVSLPISRPVSEAPRTQSSPTGLAICRCPVQPYPSAFRDRCGSGCPFSCLRPSASSWLRWSRSHRGSPGDRHSRRIFFVILSAAFPLPWERLPD